MTDGDDFTNALRALIQPISALRATLSHTGERSDGALRAVAPSHQASARNLLDYLALRTHDLRELQDQLAALGLSSLGRAEACVAATVDNVHELLARGTNTALPPRDAAAVTLAQGHQLLERNTHALLGTAPRSRRTRIMVTLPSEAADDPELVRELLKRGMNLARINCAHDDAAAWERMIAHLGRATVELGMPCRVLMDLAGPKLRTGALAPGPEVVKLRPTRDLAGNLTAPARVWLGEQRTAPTAVTASLPVPRDWVAQLHAGDRIHLTDARGARRAWHIEHAGDGGALVLVDRTSYVVSGTRLSAKHGDCAVARLPAVAAPIVLLPGAQLLVTRDDRPGSSGPPAHIPCTLPQVFGDVKRGDRIWFDDGAISGRVTDVSSDCLTVTIVDAKPSGGKLRADKGINLPDTRLSLPALDAKDEEDLRFIAAHADLVGFSFVRRPSDVVALHDRLAALGRDDLGVLLKIETREAFEHLPDLLLAAMRRARVGVMIARGDLAVECGWERLAELQEEILWICEAAHLPVVWATQVLEHLAKEGRPSRAEITDAAMSGRAECVMLNKGPHLSDAVEVLDNILRRMEAHQSKKRAMLRPLALAERFAGVVKT
jgi:pyruvate kinase